MSDHPNARLTRQALESFNSGDFEKLAALLDDDIVWHYIGASEPIRGKAGVLAMNADADWTIEGELHDVVANDDHTIALVKAHAVRGDKILDYDTAEIMHIRDGKCVERWAFSDDTARIIDFFA